MRNIRLILFFLLVLTSSTAMSLPAPVLYFGDPTAPAKIYIDKDTGAPMVEPSGSTATEIGAGLKDLDDLPGDTVDNDLVDESILDPEVTRDSELESVQAIFAHGTVVPNVCEAGEIFIDTDTSPYGFFCTALDVWNGSTTTATDHFYFESGAGFLVGDLSAITWTNSGVTENTSQFTQGACAADFDYGDSLSVTDAALPANAPGKVASFSFSLDVYFDSYPSTATGYKLVSKWDHDNDTRCFFLGIKYSTNYWTFTQGHTSGTQPDEVITTIAPALTQWYSVGVSYDNGSNSLLLCVYDRATKTFIDFDNNTAGQQDFEHTFTNPISLTAAPLMLGNYASTGSGFDGKMDNAHMYGASLTKAEFYAIFTR